jgi:hypothetical protein
MMVLIRARERATAMVRFSDKTLLYGVDLVEDDNIRFINR